jgi:hypothetical protein
LRTLFNQIAAKMTESPAKSASSGYGGFSADKKPEFLSPSLDKPPTEAILPPEDLDDRTAEEKFKDENTFDPGSFSL